LNQVAARLKVKAPRRISNRRTSRPRPKPKSRASKDAVRSNSKGFKILAAIEHIYALINIPSAVRAGRRLSGLDRCSFAWNKRIDMPWKLVSTGKREWAYRS
jgi:hypothetical protein